MEMDDELGLSDQKQSLPESPRASRVRNFMREYHLSIVIGVGFAALAMLFVWTSLPSPYNPRYLLNRALKNPTFECKDGVYSFAATMQGACSGHGGVKRRYQK